MIFSHPLQDATKRSQKLYGDTASIINLSLCVRVEKQHGHKSDGLLKVTQHHSVPDRSREIDFGQQLVISSIALVWHKNSLRSLIIQELYTRNTVRYWL